MSRDFIDLLSRLNKAGVDFVIIGGFAGVVHGCTWVTQDIDICCNFTAENLLCLQQALADINPVHRMTPQKTKLSLTSENWNQFKNLYLDTDLGQLDCLGAVQGVGPYEKAKELSQIIETENIQLRILTLDALIESKKAMNRPRDHEAVIQLQALKKMK
ncbi:MAG: hypothetical protein JW860_05370 [Sedimentisphaerales bacterium]|nr:hypothetical protein [Sedimentisphaerales bacterium]